MRILAGSDHDGFGLEPSVFFLLEADGHAASVLGALLETDFESRRHGRRLARIADIGRRGE